MNKAEIKIQIETLENDLAKLKAELNKPESFVWQWFDCSTPKSDRRPVRVFYDGIAETQVKIHKRSEVLIAPPIVLTNLVDEVYTMADHILKAEVTNVAIGLESQP